MTTTKPPRRFAACPRPLIMARAPSFGSGGPGTPVSIMTTNLKKVVIRYRQIQTFPLGMGEFFEDIYPIELFLERSAGDPRWVNLMKAVNVDAVVHFHVEGRDPTHETFWVKTPKPMPAPNDLSETLLYAASSAHYSTVVRWIDAALEVHDKIEDALEYLRTFIGSAKHPEHVEKFWPELMPFIGQMPASVKRHGEKVRKPDVSLPTQTKRDQITDLLATCSLLPDLRTVAWVKFPTEEV